MHHARLREHDEEIQKLQRQVSEYNSKPTGAVCLAKQTHRSNTTRSAQYKHNGFKLDVEKLNRVLNIDEERLIAFCEPRLTVSELAKETLKMGLIPLVVPEFKGITVGGAIMGCGGESSSHKYGLVHDICPKLQLLLGSGQIIWASESDNSDLYHAVGGSYGSFGVLLGCEIQLQKAKPWVTLTYHHFSSAKEALTKMQELMHAKEPPEFLEGIVFSPRDAVCIEGRPSDTPVGTIYRDKPWAPWFYQHAKTQKLSLSISLYDYLFRYDRGAFWMGGYVIYPPILTRVLTEGAWKLKKPTPFTKREIEKFSQLRDPGLLMRLMSSPFTSSQTLYSVLHSCEEWVAERFIVQDFTLPEANCEAFLKAVAEHSSIWPLWLCPVKNTTKPQLFSPHTNKNSSYSINVGVYGLPKTTQGCLECIKVLEDELHRLHGRKWLYTHSCYSPEQFWQIYPESQYRVLREKYSAKEMWMSIEQKVLSK